LISAACRQELRRRFGAFLKENEPLAPRTAWRTGGSAAILLEPPESAALAEVQKSLGELGLDYVVIGGGRNLLVVDEGVRERVIISLLPGFQEMALLGGNQEAGLVRAESGVSLPRLIRFCVEQGLSGYERLVGIPGSVGGAVAMNAGAYGQSFSEHLVALEVMRDGEREWRPASLLRAGYRDGGLAPQEVVVAAWMLCPRREPTELAEEAARVREKRAAKMPLGNHAGSVFKNPPGDFAGRLLEAAGCKEMVCGRARVAREHANVIVVGPGVRAAEVMGLIQEMRKRVEERFGVCLETEIRVVS
jgi:UDP-N-acetylmuramate dehydrogenase